MKQAPDVVQRRYPVGAEVVPGGVSFRVWAPAHERVRVSLEGPDWPAPVPLTREPSGYHTGVVEGVGPGARYRFVPGEGPEAYPDPASRWQPDGPHGASCVVSPAAFGWTDAGWTGLPLKLKGYQRVTWGPGVESAVRGLPGFRYFMIPTA